MWRSAVLVLVFGLGAATAGCTDGDGQGRAHASEPSGAVAAGKLCRGSLSSEAAKAVEYLTNAKSFVPDATHNDPAAAVSALAADYVPGKATDSALFKKSGRACSVDPSDGSPETLAVDLAFVRASDMQDSASRVGGAYRVGNNTAYSYPSVSDLYFPCSSPRLEGSAAKPPIVRAELVADPYAVLPRKPKSETEKVRRENLVVLNSVALAGARDLHCADDGGLRSEADLRSVPKAGVSGGPAGAGS
jgi:hypothetical protein